MSVDPSMGSPDPSSPLMRSTSKLKMAAFGLNISRGLTATCGEGAIAHMDWDQQLRIARVAEAAGLEAILPVARFRGYAGDSGWSRESYDSIPWAAGVSAVTSRIQVMSTIHVPLNHPTKLAKELATVDHVSQGRSGINVVAGWNIDEFAMFGIRQLEHDDRYVQAAEWLSIVRRLWTEEQPFDFDGRFYTLRDVYSEPKPLQRPRPPIMNAGSSPAGRQFAAEHADLCFIAAHDLASLKDVACDVRERAAAVGRQVQVWTPTSILCGETAADVDRRYEYFVQEKGDWAGAESAIRAGMAGGSGVEKKLTREMMESRVVGSFGHRLIGTPEQVVEKMQQLVDAGIDGVAGIWFDYERDIQTFAELVAPLAEREGLRDPSRRAATASGSS